MSFHRENVIWQSRNGLWSRGFFECYENGSSEERDREWDVGYNLDVFSWASVGHATQEAAARSWAGANPGGAWVYGFSESDAIANAKLDEMAQEYLKRVGTRRRT